jgi:thermostable 8-oxoguanine DNA glycosylase
MNGSTTSTSRILNAEILTEAMQRYDYSNYSLLGDIDPRFPEAGNKMRSRGYLLRDELYEIARWKSPRRAELVKTNLTEAVKQVSGGALFLKDIDHGQAVRLLDELKGIGIRTASAVLAVVDPQNFGVVDYRVWNTLHRWQPDRFASQNRDYWPIDRFLFCLEAIRELAQATGLTCREVDMALWQMDKDVSSKEKHRACRSRL